MTRTVDEYRAAAIAHVIALSKIDPETGAAIAPTREEYETTRPPGAPAYSTLRLRGIPWATILDAAGLQMQSSGIKAQHYPPPTPAQLESGIITGDPHADAAIRHIRKIARYHAKTHEPIPPTRAQYEESRPPEAPTVGYLRHHGWNWARVMRAAGMQPRPRGGDRTTHSRKTQPEPIPAPVVIVTGNVTSDNADPADIAHTTARLPAALVAALQAKADAAGISRNRFIVRALHEASLRRRAPQGAISEARDTQLAIRMTAALMEDVKRAAHHHDQPVATWIVAVIAEAITPPPAEIDPLTHPDYAHLPQPQRDPMTGQFAPPRDADGHPIWRVRVTMGERTCQSCGATFTPFHDDLGRLIGACPICTASAADEDGTRRQRKQPSVPTVDYLRAGEYEIVGQARR